MYFIRYILNNLLLTLFLFSCFSTVIGQYRVYRQDNFLKALIFFKNYKSEFKICSIGSPLKFKAVFAIVAPEIGEYNNAKNYFETNSLKVLYVHNGSCYSDFSIGYFQMKPSFVEKLEKTIMTDSKLYRKFKNYIINYGDFKSDRRERIKRLENIKWQFKYLKLFLIIANNKKTTQKFLSFEEELQYFSTIYNTGFDKKNEEVLNEMTKERFPNNYFKKFNYSKVCLEFYNAIK